MPVSPVIRTVERLAADQPYNMADAAHFAAIANQQTLPLFAPHLFGQAGQVVRTAFLDGLLDLRGGLIARGQELVHSQPGQADRIEDRGVGVANQHGNRWSQPLHCFQKFARSPPDRREAQDDGAEVLLAEDLEGRFGRKPLDAVSY